DDVIATPDATFTISQINYRRSVRCIAADHITFHNAAHGGSHRVPGDISRITRAGRRHHVRRDDMVGACRCHWRLALDEAIGGDYKTASSRYVYSMVPTPGKNVAGH